MNRTVSAESCPLCLKIWNLAREQLSVKYPFFRKLIWDFSFQESSDTYTAGTDGHIIYFAPEFLIRTFQTDPDALESLLLHILYHCLFLHLVMETPSDRILWNQACDISVDRLITVGSDTISPSVIYQILMTDASPKEHAAVDDHRFWRLADRPKLLEQIKKIWNFVIIIVILLFEIIGSPTIVFTSTISCILFIAVSIKPSIGCSPIFIISLS